LSTNAGYCPIQWDVDSGDPAAVGWAKRMARNVLARVRPDAIVFMHTNGRRSQTAEALVHIILRTTGYNFLTISELLAAGTPVFVDSR
jgi:peptidoglycan-N-acetylglucosamine deacetylase